MSCTCDCSASMEYRPVCRRSLTPIQAFSIATQSPSLNDQIMFVGQGNGRADSLSFWDNSWNSVPAGSATHSGYVASGTFAKCWGLNNVASNSVFGDNGAGVTHVVNLMTGDGIARDVMSLATQIDQSSGTFEGQGVGGDSGTSVFRKNPSTNKWELAGIVNAIFTFSNQPGGTAVYGDLTTFADLLDYRNSIYSIINSHQAYSLPGDLNLDGVVSGNGTGSVTTDDVTAFVQGWGSQQATGDINSWKKGDLNLDGKVDVLDFLMLRQAFNASGSGVSLQSLSALVGQGGGTGAVPAPLQSCWRQPVRPYWFGWGVAAASCPSAKSDLVEPPASYLGSPPTRGLRSILLSLGR